MAGCPCRLSWSQMYSWNYSLEILDLIFFFFFFLPVCFQVGFLSFANVSTNFHVSIILITSSFDLCFSSRCVKSSDQSPEGSNRRQGYYISGRVRYQFLNQRPHRYTSVDEQIEDLLARRVPTIRKYGYLNKRGLEGFIVILRLGLKGRSFLDWGLSERSNNFMTGYLNKLYL